jgi:uncharacterized membrane protein required for colicin V production
VSDWPDLVIGLILLIAGIKGLRAGFVSELGGAVAFFAALITPWYYNGAADGSIDRLLHTGPGSAHVLGMVATGLATYAIVLAAAWLLNRIAKLPLVNVANALGGAAVGLLKGAALCWAILYVTLLFPLSPDVRAALHRASLVAYLTAPDARIDDAVVRTAPWFARPFIRHALAGHRT